MTLSPLWRILFPVVILLVDAAPVFCAGADKVEWQLSTPLPDARAGYAAGVVGDRLVLAGGTYWKGSAGNWIEKIFCSTTHAFDPHTETWTRLPDAPVSLAYAPGAVAGGRFFVIGGLQDGRVSRRILILEKDGSGFRWSDGPPLPEPRVFAEAAVAQGMIFVVGGSVEFETMGDKRLCCASHTATTTVWSLDSTELGAGWKEHAAFPGHRRWTPRLLADGRYLYQFGGRFITAPDQPVRYFDEVWRYDIGSDTWMRIAELPVDIRLSRPVFAAGRIFLVGQGRRTMVFEPDTGRFSDAEGLPMDALVDYFAWMPPFIVGAGGETREERPRRRADWTFLGRVKSH